MSCWTDQGEREPQGVLTPQRGEAAPACAEPGVLAVLRLLTEQQRLEAVVVTAPLADGEVRITIHKRWPSSPTADRRPYFWWAVGDRATDGQRAQADIGCGSALLAYDLALSALHRASERQPGWTGAATPRAALAR